LHTLLLPGNSSGLLGGGRCWLGRCRRVGCLDTTPLGHVLQDEFGHSLIGVGVSAHGNLSKPFASVLQQILQALIECSQCVGLVQILHGGAHRPRNGNAVDDGLPGLRRRVACYRVLSRRVWNDSDVRRV
jgi:hypothetical protein